MDRIQHASATPSHQFTEGNPALAVAATTVTATWLNGVQEELVRLIEEAGLTPDELATDQVLAALGVLFQANGTSAPAHLIEALTADAVAHVLTVDVTHTGNVVVLVQGTAPDLTAIHLTGSVPPGAFVWVVQRSPSSCPVTTALPRVATDEPLGAMDWALLVMGPASASWFVLAAADSENVRVRLAAAVGAETARATAAEVALEMSVNALESSLSSEVGRAQAAEGSILGAVNSEGARAVGAEVALGGRIDSLVSILRPAGGLVALMPTATASDVDHIQGEYTLTVHRSPAGPKTHAELSFQWGTDYAHAGGSTGWNLPTATGTLGTALYNAICAAFGVDPTGEWPISYLFATWQMAGASANTSAPQELRIWQEAAGSAKYSFVGFSSYTSGVNRWGCIQARIPLSPIMGV